MAKSQTPPAPALSDDEIEAQEAAAREAAEDIDALYPRVVREAPITRPKRTSFQIFENVSMMKQRHGLRNKK